MIRLAGIGIACVCVCVSLCVVVAVVVVVLVVVVVVVVVMVVVVVTVMVMVVVTTVLVDAGAYLPEVAVKCGPGGINCTTTPSQVRLRPQKCHDLRRSPQRDSLHPLHGNHLRSSRNLERIPCDVR